MDKLSYDAQQAVLCCLHNKKPQIIYNWLVQCLNKRIEKGQPVMVEYLAFCSSMGKLSKASFDECKCCAKMTKEARMEFRFWVARHMISELKSKC